MNRLGGATRSSAMLKDVVSDQPPPDDVTELQEMEKVSGIKRDIELLQQLFAEKKRRQLLKQSATAIDDTTTSQESMSKPGFAQDPRIASELSRHLTAESESMAAGRPADQPLGDHSPVSARRVVPGVVDAFELGNSLFLAGNLDQALRSYNTVRRTNMSPFDRTLLEFMIASCHRGLGEYDQTAAAYRVVEQDLNGVRFVQSAREWQDFLKKRTQMIDAMNELSDKADLLIKRAEDVLSDDKKK